MITATASEFRKEYKDYMDQVTNDMETLVIHRGKNKAVVMISLEEFESLQATYHELSSSKNAKRLIESLTRAKQGDVQSMDLAEL